MKIIPQFLAEFRAITKSQRIGTRQGVRAAPAGATACPLARGMPHRALHLGLLLALPAVLAACVYRMPIRQGNYLDPAAIAQVKPGMTHSQVRFLLGTPQVPTPFDSSRWDYDYYLNLHRLSTPRRSHVVVWFDKGVVSRVQSDATSAPITTETRGGIKYPVPY